MILEAILLQALMAPVAPELKCPITHALPGMDRFRPVLVMNGELLQSDPEVGLESVEPEDIQYVQVTCWNPDTDALPASSGVSVILVFTTQAMERARADLRFLAGVTRDFEKLHGRAPTGLDELGLTGPAAERFTFASVDGVTRIGTAGPRDYHCTLSGALLEDDAITCTRSFDLARMKLRERYEQGMATF